MATNIATIDGEGSRAQAKRSNPRRGNIRLGRFAVAALALLTLPMSIACEEGGVGDPCIPEDEFDPNFAGFSKDEVNIESRSFQCRTRVCLVANFQGRVSCKYGQAAGEQNCRTPDLTQAVDPVVLPQLEARRPSDAVYCSYRCKAPQADAPVQECPEGFQCREMLADVGLGDAQLAGSYCIKNGKEVSDPAAISPKECAGTSCGDPADLY